VNRYEDRRFDAAPRDDLGPLGQARFEEFAEPRFRVLYRPGLHRSTHPDINVAGAATWPYAALVCTTPGSRDKVSVRRSTFRLA